MSEFRWGYACFSLWVIVVAFAERVHAVQVLSQYSQQYEVNGKPTQRNTIILSATESDPTGSLRIGDYTVNITALPPRFNYRFEEVGRIPRNTQLNINKACLVNDVDSFYQKQNAANEIQGILPQGTSNAQVQLNAQRRLLFFDPIGTGLAIAALVVGTRALSVANAAKREVDDLRSNVVGPLIGNVQTLQATSVAQAAALSNQQNQISLVANNSKLLLQGQVQQQQQLDAIGNTIDVIANQTTRQFAAINDTLARNAALINAQFTEADTRTKDAFNNVYNLITTLTGNLQTQVDSVIRNAFQTATSLQKLTIDLTRQIRNIQIDRLTVGAYYEALNKLDPALKPFTLGAGIPAASSLVGSQQRLLLDEINVNWVSNTTGNIYQIYNSRITFYTDSVFAIDNAAFVTTLDNFATLFGTNACRRSYVDGDQTETTPASNPNCKVWAEIRTFSCSSQSLSPKFRWGLDFNNTITPSMCANNVNPTAAPVQVIKRFDDLIQYFAGEPCKVQDGPYRMTTFRTYQAFQFPAKPTLCPLSWKDQRYRAEARTGDVSIGYFVLLMVQQSFSAAYLDLFNLELQLYGRNPGGLKYERKPNDYVPVSYNGTVPIYDGGAKPVDCTYTSWLGVDRQTVPIYSVTPLAGAIVSKGIRFSIDGPVCTDPATCYPVGESDVTANIQLNNDASHVLPGAFLMVGFLDDFGQGIWDIPSRSLSASPSTSERAFTPSYILMPPGTTSTFELADWISRNTDLFDPEKGAVSPGIYRFETARDVEGFPFCSIPGAEPVNGYEITTRGCIRPYSYQASGASTSFAAIASPEREKYPSQCTALNPTLIYSNRKSELVTNTINTAQGSPAAVIAATNTYSVSFQYYKDRFTSDNGGVDALEIASSTNILRFGVTTNGQPRLLIVSTANPNTVRFDSLLTMGMNVDLRNGVWRSIVFTMAGTGTVTRSFGLRIDGNLLALTPIGSIAFVGADAFIRSVRDITLNSAGAQVMDATIYPTSFLAPETKAVRSCALPNLGGGRCSNITETISIAKRNVTSTENVVCATDSKLLIVDTAYDLIYPVASSLLSSSFASSWSASFWVKGYRLLSGIAFNLRAGRAQIQISASSLSNSVLVNGVSFPLATISDGNSHFIVITFNSATTIAQLYYDGVLAGSAQTPALQPASSPSISNSNGIVSMFKAYDYILTATQQNSEGLCQVSATIGAFGFIPPVGYCSSVPGSNYGYCREPMMCQGHCSAFSVIDPATGTFSALNNVCDDGFALPECTSRCSRIDPITGQCLDKIGKSAVGLTPGGVLCPLLSNFKASVVPASKLFGATPRFWQYTVSVGVPAGTITNVIDTGSCPLTTITPNIDGSLLVNLQNSNNVNSIVNILYAPDGVFTGEATCEPPCCSLSVDNPVTVKANSVLSYPVPAAGCGNVSVIIQQAVNVFDPFANTTIGSTQECSRFTGNDVSFIQSTAFNQLLPTNVQASIQVSQNLVAKGIKDTSDALGLQLVNLLALGAESGFQAEAFKTSLALQAQAIRNSVFNPINFTTSLPPYDIQDSVDNLNNITAAGNAALQLTINRFSANEQQRQELEVVSRELEANITALLMQSSREQALIVQAYKNSLIQNPDGGYDSSLESFLQDVGRVGAAVAIEAAHLGKSFIDTGLDLIGLPGSLLGGFGNLLGGFVKFLIYYLIVKLVGAIFTGIAPGASAAISSQYERLRDSVSNRGSSSKYSELPTKDVNSRSVISGEPPMNSTQVPINNAVGSSTIKTQAFLRSHFHKNRMN